MPLVSFLPAEKAVEVPSGTELLDAVRLAGLELESPCGGKGTCGHCLLRVVSGEVVSAGEGATQDTALADGFVLACQTLLLDSPVTIEVPESHLRPEGRFLDSSGEADPRGVDFLPAASTDDSPVVKCFVKVSDPRLEDGLSDLDRLTRRIQRDGHRREVVYPLSVIRETAEALRGDGGNVTVTLSRERERLRVIGIEPGDRTAGHYGIAVDVGTTTVAAQLVSLRRGEVVATLSDYNDQVVCGIDVISRINYGRRPDRLADLRARALRTINRLVRQAAEGHGISPEEIRSAAVSGNTTMMHLLLGLKPEYIRLAPYTPTVLDVPGLRAADVGIDIHPETPVYLSPGVGSYVGGDITAGILCTDLTTNSDAIVLFIDIGTNGELVVGNRDFLMTCACSAGPAFEGGGIACGMRAARGAIERVEVEAKTGVAAYSTIGAVRPRGICGSGMISLLASLFLGGWIDPAGELNRARTCPAIRQEGRHASYTIVPAGEADAPGPIAVSEPEIENILRAKAAIYSACSLMLDRMGVGFEDLAKVYIAGGFGRFLDLDQAIVIGLAPDLPRERFCYLGNASLAGTHRVLVSQASRTLQAELARRMTYLELSSDARYLDQYTGALFLPHTDLERFPSVRAAMKRGG